MDPDLEEYGQEIGLRLHLGGASNNFTLKP